MLDIWRTGAKLILVPEEITPIEFEYYLPERAKAKYLITPAQYMLYVCMERIDAEPEIDSQMGQEDYSRLYGKTICTLKDMSLYMAKNNELIPTELHCVAEGPFGWRTFDMSMNEDDTVSATGPEAMKQLCELFFSPLFRRGMSAASAVCLTDGYFIDADDRGVPKRRTELVSHGRRDDGSAGALVPSHPKKPTPAIQQTL